MSTAPDRIIVPRRRAEKLNEDHDVAATISLSPPGPQDNTELEYLLATPEREATAVMREALELLVGACGAYRVCHDHDGDGHINTGRAWDKMRAAEANALAALAAAREEAGDG